MKTAIILFMTLFMAGVSFGQDVRHFDYVACSDEVTMVTPLFDRLDNNRPVERFIVQNEEKIKRHLDSLLVQCFTYDELSRMGVDNNTAASSALVYADAAGKIRYMQFILRGNDKNIVTDQKLYQFYQLLKKNGIDTAWGRIAGENGESMSDPQALVAVGFKMFWKRDRLMVASQKY